jgi:Zn ribbon nucleic-acid-binding protein
MRHLTKLLIVLSFGVAAALVFFNDAGQWPISAQVAPQPTPPANTAANSANTAKPAATPPAQSGDKTIPKSFVLGKESQTEDGEVPFDHETHASKMYMPDGKSTIACVECHHTDQPKSALKPPLSTSEREVALTMDSWRASPLKVKGCRECHFQSGNIPEGSKLPTATVTERGKEVSKDLNNELAYHINCNTCHDAAAKLRPELKSRAGFATSTDCKTCHRPN